MLRYIMVVSGIGSYFVLGLDPRNKGDCDQVIRWMHLGQFNMEYVVCTYNRDDDCFISEDGRTFTPEQGPYTEAAWSKFRYQLKRRNR